MYWMHRLICIVVQKIAKKMLARALLELPRSEVFKWSAAYFASRQGLKRDIFGGEVFANTDVFSAIDAE